MSNVLYLQNEYGIFIRSLCEINIGELIRQPHGIERNEWIANHILFFYNQMNCFYGVLTEICTKSRCPIMIGPENSYYHWIDERGRKVKCSAPEYIDSTMIFIQKVISNERIFPTRLDQKFSSTFDIIIGKIVRLLFHCFSHLYGNHYLQIIEMEFHSHLNSLFLHFLSFLIKTDLIPSKNSFHSNSLTSSSSSSSLANSREIFQFRTELESLSLLYQFLSKQWQRAFAQLSAQKRKTTTTNLLLLPQS